MTQAIITSIKLLNISQGISFECPFVGNVISILESELLNNNTDCHDCNNTGFVMVDNTEGECCESCTKQGENE